MAGVYLTSIGGEVICLMGDVVSGSSVREAVINVIELVVQFVLEEVSLTLDDVEFVIDVRKLVGWLTGETNVNWIIDFLRNTCRAKMQALQDVIIEFEQVKNFKVSLLDGDAE
ncbi:hypothetical protein PIB30_028698 [Stylosanthes scabra]|uniref:Coatomer subunit zeta n=1 Tax=Stylosanthes scabra TaxID=79078 RepID=A0ABU6UCZ5_9FABA|nr:hypothetical protein [Stylosanthes scabra]